MQTGSQQDSRPHTGRDTGGDTLTATAGTGEQTRGTDGTDGIGAIRGTGTIHIIGMTRGTGATRDITDIMATTDITDRGIMTAGLIITRITAGTARADTYMAAGTHISETGTALPEAAAPTSRACLHQTCGGIPGQ